MGWHYKYKDEVIFSNEKDPRNGKYLVYDTDTFDYILNNKDWVYNNDAFEEHSYILDYLEYMLESNNGELVFIPTADVAVRLETRDLILRG